MPDNAANPRSSRSSGSYACEQVFTFGLWGLEPRHYDLGVEALLRDLRLHSMNCIVGGPIVAAGPEGMAQLKEGAALCGRYGIFVLPLFTAPDPDLALIRLAAETCRDEPAVLGWYIKDEPAPDFLPKFLECKQMLARMAPAQPALCLFYRPDSMADFAPHQPIILSDCYPITYAHDGTSLGPHFALREGEFALARGLSRFNFWGRRGLLEWMDLCRAYVGDRPHWITLQAFESGDGHQVRWREPIAPELRLQVYMAIAGGAKGINFFRYECITDHYGNALPSAHGEHTPLWDEIGRLGAEITPFGPLLVDAEVNEPVSVVARLRPTPDPGDRIEARWLRARSREVDYLVAFNNDVLVRSTAQVYLDKRFLRGRRVYDLHRLEPCAAEDLPGAMAFALSLEPGGGRMLAVASEADFQSDAAVIRAGRCWNERRMLEPEIELGEKSGLDLRRVMPRWEASAESMTRAEYEQAHRSLDDCRRALQAAMREHRVLPKVRAELEQIRRALGERAATMPAAETNQLGLTFRGLLEKLWAGEACSIERQVEELGARLWS